MSVRDEIMASLGQDGRSEASSPWVKIDGWTFDFRPRAVNTGRRRWHWFGRTEGAEIVSGCGSVRLPQGSNLTTQGHRSERACRACLDAMAASRQKELMR